MAKFGTFEYGTGIVYGPSSDGITIQSIRILSETIVEVLLAVPVVIDDLLLSPSNYPITFTDTGTPADIQVRKILPFVSGQPIDVSAKTQLGLVSTRRIQIVTDVHTKGVSYTVSIGALKNAATGLQETGLEGTLKSAFTKVDSTLRSIPNHFSKLPEATLVGVLSAIAIEDARIGGDIGETSATTTTGITASTILSYNSPDATFTRASEAAYIDIRTGSWQFAAQNSDAFVLSGVPRILGDGSIFIEGERTNYVLNNESIGDASWSAQNGASVPVVSGETGPYGNQTASRIIYPGLSAIELVRPTPATNPSSPNIVLSQFVRGNKDYRVFYNTTVPSITSRAFSQPTSEDIFQRDVSVPAITNYDEQYDLRNGPTPLAGYIILGLPQVEVGSFASSPIRAGGAAATRAAERLSFPAASYPSLIAERFQFDWWPAFDSEQATGTYVFFATTGVGYVRTRFTGSEWLFEYESTAGTSDCRITALAVSDAWSIGDRISITVNHFAGQLVVENTTRNLSSETTGATSAAAGTGSWSGTTLDVGQSANSSHCYGILGQPNTV
jgi:hypothetical protein